MTTIHNARKKIYAKQQDTYNRTVYERGHYKKNGNEGIYTGNSEGKKFSGAGKDSVGSEFTKSQIDKDGFLTDAYTGERVQAKTTSPDHIYPISEFHKNGGYMLSDTEKCDFATDKNNLASTNRSINKSMKDKNKIEWASSKSSGREVTNAEYFGIDNSRLKNAVKKGNETAKIHLPTNYQKAQFYIKNIFESGGKDAAAMAAYSAIGVIIHDFALAAIQELKFLFKNRKELSYKELFNLFKEKMAQVLGSLKDKWKDIIKGSFEAGITAFLSNMLVFVINLFATTLKKIVSMIRAGFASLCQAIKLIAHKPDNLTQEEANIEAVKILTTGIIGALSLGLSATIEKALQAIPGLRPIMMFPIPSIGREQRTVSDAIAVTLSAMAGCLVSTIVIYFIDKIRSNDQRDNLQIRLLNQSGLVLQYETAASWCAVGNAYQQIANIAQHGEETLNNTKKALESSYEEVVKADQELDKAMDDLDTFFNK